MIDFEKLGKLYLGRELDPERGEPNEVPVLYDSKDLTTHAVIRNEDGSYSWKFDPYVQHWDSIDLSQDDIQQLWKNITCPTQLHYGADSWASNPEKDGRMQYFGDNVSVKEFADAGHWLHHDQFDGFVGTLQEFL